MLECDKRKTTSEAVFKRVVITMIKRNYPMPEDEKVKFKEKGKDYKFKMDMENMKHYPEGDFMEALEYIGVFEK